MKGLRRLRKRPERALQCGVATSEPGEYRTELSDCASQQTKLAPAVRLRSNDLVFISRSAWILRLSTSFEEASLAVFLQSSAGGAAV
jgi:hypothetical protein